MKRADLSLVIVWIVVMMLLGGCSKCENLLLGGGFEQQSELQKSPAGWFATEVSHTKEFVTFEWDDEKAHGGERSVSIAIDADHPEERICYNWTKPVQGFRVGASYELSGWIRSENLPDAAWIVAQCWDESRSEMVGFATTQKDYPVTGTSDWVQVGTVFTVPEGTAEVIIRAGICTPENRGGRAWFDDLAVREVQ